MEKKTCSILIPIAVIAAAVNAVSSQHYSFHSQYINLIMICPHFHQRIFQASLGDKYKGLILP